MSRYTSGWTWQDNATEEQTTAPGAEAQCRPYEHHNEDEQRMEHAENPHE